MVRVPPPPPLRLNLAVTGHRETHPAYAANSAAIRAVFERLFALIDATVTAERASLGTVDPVRLHCLLADGTDQLAAELGIARGWDLACPLPFGRDLNCAVNAHPGTRADAEAILAGNDPADPDCRRRAAAIRTWYGQARVFELADHDAVLSRQFLEIFDRPDDRTAQTLYSAGSSAQVALAGRIMVEQSDLLLAVWDGVSANLAGGTGHTIAAALDRGCAVVRIDPANPEAWHLLHAPESLAAMPARGDDETTLAALVRAALRPGEGGALRSGAETLAGEHWHGQSPRLWTGYRRIEALFGGGGRPFRSLITTYESPEAIAAGSGAAVLEAARTLPAGDTAMPGQIAAKVLERFAWTDGISARLSDSYRGSMTTSFLLSALAIVCGIAYEPFGGLERKWLFALGEFLLLGAILVIIWQGGKRRWHKRWFETRRVAEYFRHAPILLLLGVARPPGRWPKGSDTSWPEYYARHALRELGLPQVAVTKAYLRHALDHLLDAHVVSQRDYHRFKSKRLNTVHHRLDRLSERLFQAAIISVSIYLTVAGGAALGLLDHGTLYVTSKAASFLGVAFPTFGAALAGIRYFGDFERFAAISEVTAEKLDAIHDRIQLLQAAPDHGLTYAQVSELVHAADDAVVAEIESWQAVFGGKHITVPV
ncbi:MAG TPA: hypothetical protein VFV30_11495 [Novosphingobium sp.]|nr:hypothetical protein [Novosphingobium sp.]